MSTIATADEATKIAAAYLRTKKKFKQPLYVDAVRFDGNCFTVIFHTGSDEETYPYSVKVDKEGNVVGWAEGGFAEGWKWSPTRQ